MSLDLAGIVNESEFYTHHYVTAILEEDLKGVFSQWQEREKAKQGTPEFEVEGCQSSVYDNLRAVCCQPEFLTDFGGIRNQQCSRGL